MNTHITAHKAEVRHQWFFLILCFYSVYAGVPGPCKHSVTQGHLLNLRRLIKNQLQNGCSITYTFTERQNLSVVCYVKAAFPHILDLLNTQFRYSKDSDNYRYTNSLKNLIYNIYSQRCIASINEEIENSPVTFVRVHVTLARAALEKAEEVIHMYMNLMTKSDAPVNWNCEEEYTEDYPESTTESLVQSPECLCTCPAVSNGSSKTSMSTSQRKIHLKSTPLPQRLPLSSVETLQNSDRRTKQLDKTEEVKSITHLLSNPAHTLPSWTPAILKPVDETANSNIKMMHTSSSSSGELPDYLPDSTDFTLLSTMPGPYQKDSIQNTIERSTAILLAKRSLDSKSQKGSSHSHNKVLQTRLTTTSTPTVDLKTAKIGFMPVAKDNPVQMSKDMVPVTSTVLSSLKTGMDLSEHLTTLDKQLDNLNSQPEYFKIHSQTLVREPKTFMQIVSETKLRKDSGSQEDKQETHTTEDHQDRRTQRNSAMTETSSTLISFASALIIILACGGLWLTTVIFYRQQKVSDQRCICKINQNSVPSVASSDRKELEEKHKPRSDRLN